VGDIADYYIDNMLSDGQYVPTRYSKKYNSKEEKKVAVNNDEIFIVDKDAKNEQWVILIEKGLKREPIITSTPLREYRSKGYRITQPNTPYTNRHTDLVNMQSTFTHLRNYLNTLHKTDLLFEKQYDKVLEAFEPFIDEALAFEEFESMIEPQTKIASGKKKKIFKRRG